MAKKPPTPPPAPPPPEATAPPPAAEPEVPFDESVLRATEQRFQEIQDREAVAFEALQPGDRLRRNPPEAVERRLRRMGIDPQTARATAEGLAGNVPFAAVEAAELPAEAVGLERIVGRNELMSFQYLEAGDNAGRSIGRVVVRNAQGRTRGYGTGFLVSPRLLLTNNHVLHTAAEAAPSTVQFNYQTGLDGQMLPPAEFALDPQTFFVTSAELDFTLVAVRETSAAGERLSRFGACPLNALEGEILAGEHVSIVQHPNGEPKQVALRENEVLRLPESGDRFLHYQTDTSPGSSGSPVFNDQWEVVALHHSGTPRRDEQGRIRTRDGRRWTRAMGEHRIDWIANEGIRVAAVVEHLRQLTDLGEPQRRLLAEVLEATAPPPPDESGTRPAPPPPVAPQVPAAPPHTLSVAAAPGQAIFTIPVQVAVSIGPAVLQPVAPAPRDVSVAPARPAASSPLAEATAELERHARRRYYDEAADRRDRDAYYQGISAEVGPQRLFHALRQLLESTHRPRPAYNPSVHVYPWVDLQPNRKLKSVYSGQEFEPLEFIRDDSAILEAREARIQELLTTEAAADPARLQAEIDFLEAQLPFNCEHVVPQSWFNYREPMKGDLHHLFACESGCNSFRGNTPYFDFGQLPEVVRQGCGRREANRFEPSSGKGAVARATLYFLVRYPGVINRTPSEYTPDRLAIFLDWHRQHPVGEYERHRNQAVAEKQGNRNPFIDHPEWADVVAFRLGLG